MSENLISKNGLQEAKMISKSNLLGKEIDVYGDAVTPLFLAKDVAEWIGHTDPRKMVQTVDDDEKLIGTIILSGQHRNVWFLTENGLYEVLMFSRKPIAKEFKKGVKKILHDIRTKGSYSVKVPKTFAEALRLAADQQELIEEQQKQIQTITPKADFADQLFRKEAKIKIGTAGKVLNLPFGSKTLFKKLRELGILFKNSTECCQRYLDAGYFVMESKLIKMGDTDKMVSVTYATLKGLAYIGYLFGTKPNTEQAKSLFKKALQIDAAENKHLELTVNL